jgi:hypothetical protein
LSAFFSISKPGAVKLFEPPDSAGGLPIELKSPKPDELANNWTYPAGFARILLIVDPRMRFIYTSGTTSGFY